MDTLTRLRDIKGIGKKRANSIAATLEQSGSTLDDFFRMSASDLKLRFKLPKNVIMAVLSLTPISTKSVDISAKKEIRVLTKQSSDYPKRLLDILNGSAPSTLHIWGNLDLLNKPTVGFCGSRNVTEKGIEVTTDIARQIAELGWVVVSGHARGVDTAAHRTALENGASTIIVAAEGISVFRLRKELKEIAKPEQLLIVSEFPPESGWTIGRAMTRNKTIIGLSDAMVLVEARLEGGTFEAGKAALKLKMPLYVADYQVFGESAAGNAYFLKHGATALRKNRQTDKANIKALCAAVTSKRAITTSEPMQIEDEAATKPEQLSLI